MNQIHLLIPCTARKTLDVPVPMNICEHSSDTLKNTLHDWEQAFFNTEEKVKAKDLYSGQTFIKLRAQSNELCLSLKILSAGFGLIDSNTELPGYNATFSPNKNKVPTPQSSWWHEVNHSKLPSMSLKETFDRHHNDYFIIIASNAYLQAIQEDLIETLSQVESPQHQFAIFTTSIPKPLHPYSKCFVNCSRKVLTHREAKSFGLSTSDKNITAIAALMFLKKIELTKPNFSDIISDLNIDFASLKLTQRPARTTQTTEFIKEFIWNELLKSNRNSTASILRTYRDSGYACSVERFSEFYKQVKSEKGLL